MHPRVGLDVMSLTRIEPPIFQPVASLSYTGSCRGSNVRRTHGVVTFAQRKRKTGATSCVYFVWLPSVLQWVGRLNSRVLRGRWDKLLVEGSLFCGLYELASWLVGQFRSSYKMEGCVPRSIDSPAPASKQPTRPFKSESLSSLPLHLPSSRNNALQTAKHIL
jgi:hypothetical protein